MNKTTTNSTGDEQQKTVELLSCSSVLTVELKEHLIFISILNSVLSLTAFLGNALILVALPKESSLHPPSKLLLRCLAITDLCVGFITEPLAVTSWMSRLHGQWNICNYIYVVNSVLNFILTNVSLCTLTAVSVDRLLALLLGLGYRQVVTLKRTYLFVITFWVLPSAFSPTFFWNPVMTLWYGIVITVLCLLTSIFSYTMIFLNLRRHQNQVQDHVQQPNQANPLHIERYKKAVSTAIWLQLTLIACYLPNIIALSLITKRGLSSSTYHVWNYALSLLFLNSSLNPILYCWKIEEIRQAVKNTIRQVLCHCFSC